MIIIQVARAQYLQHVMNLVASDVFTGALIHLTCCRLQYAYELVVVAQCAYAICISNPAGPEKASLSIAHDATQAASNSAAAAAAQAADVAMARTYRPPLGRMREYIIYLTSIINGACHLHIKLLAQLRRALLETCMHARAADRSCSGFADFYGN